MTQPALPGLTSTATTHRPVRETSRAVYRAMWPTLEGRKRVVAWCLETYMRHHTDAPTSAELAAWAEPSEPFGDATQRLLTIRRRLSDLCKAGLVESVPGGNRICRVSGRTCVTWRLVSR
jgi:hypothetical protein